MCLHSDLAKAVSKAKWAHALLMEEYPVSGIYAACFFSYRLALADWKWHNTSTIACCWQKTESLPRLAAVHVPVCAVHGMAVEASKLPVDSHVAHAWLILLGQDSSQTLFSQLASATFNAMPAPSAYH